MINTSKYEGHTPGPWETNSEDSQGVWQDHDETLPYHIAWVHSDRYWEDMSETEFMRMMADKDLIADAPLLLAEVKRLREELFDTHAFYSIMEQKLAFAVGIKQGLLTSISMDDLVDSMNRDYHDRLNEHMNGRLRE